MTWRRRVDAWHRFSLRRTLLLVLLPGMLLLMVAELWLTWRGSLDAANSADLAFSLAVGEVGEHG